MSLAWPRTQPGRDICVIGLYVGLLKDYSDWLPRHLDTVILRQLRGHATALSPYKSPPPLRWHASIHLKPATVAYAVPTVPVHLQATSRVRDLPPGIEPSLVLRTSCTAGSPAAEATVSREPSALPRR